MDQKSNVIPFANAKSTTIVTGTPVEKINKKSDNDGTGGGNMNDKYVTHEELELSNEKLLHHIDNKFAEMDKRFAEIDKKIDLNTEKVDTKFANQKVWIILTLISVFASAAGIITFISNILK